MKWTYGDAYLTNPILPGEIAVWPDGSTAAVHNLFDENPSFFRKANLIFADPPWNLGNLNSFYTKAERTDYQISFELFYKTLFSRIRDVKADICYVEVGKQYLCEFLMEMKAFYPHVTFYNSTYYHNQKNKCYIIRGSRKAKKPSLDDMDEEDVIRWICQNEEPGCILDPCMGQGLVGRYASEAGRPFIGGELNPKRLSVLLKKVPGYKILHSEEDKAC